MSWSKTSKEFFTFIVLAVLATLWMQFVDAKWPDADGAVPAEAPPQGVLCEKQDECEHPKASRRMNRKFKDGDMNKTPTKTIRKIVNDERIAKQAKAAYRRYTETHSYSKASPGVAALAAASAAPGVEADWPSPKEWWTGFKLGVKCVTVGATDAYYQKMCGWSSQKHTTSFRVAEMLQMTANEVGRVSVKCGGAAILGGVKADGKESIRKAFGVGVRGGWGMAAFGAGCLWGEYYDRFDPW